MRSLASNNNLKDFLDLKHPNHKRRREGERDRDLGSSIKERLDSLN